MTQRFTFARESTIDVGVITKKQQDTQDNPYALYNVTNTPEYEAAPLHIAQKDNLYFVVFRDDTNRLRLLKGEQSNLHEIAIESAIERTSVVTPNRDHSRITHEIQYREGDYRSILAFSTVLSERHKGSAYLTDRKDVAKLEAVLHFGFDRDPTARMRVHNI